MPPRRAAKKKGRVQQLEVASESLSSLGQGGDDAKSLGRCGSDKGGSTVDRTENDENNSGISNTSSSRLTPEGPSQHEQQTEYVEKIIEEVEKKGARTSLTAVSIKKALVQR